LQDYKSKRTERDVSALEIEMHITLYEWRAQCKYVL